MTELVGQTPALRYPLPGWIGSELILKLEMFNPTATMKIRAAAQMIREAEDSQQLLRGGTIVESSSGNTATGLAALAAVRGYGFVAVVDGHCPAGKIALVQAYGGRVEQIPSGHHGLPSPDERTRLARALAAEIPGGWFAAQRTNPANPAGYATLADELLEQVPQVDTLVGAVGTGGSLCGTARRLRALGRHLVVVGVEPTGSTYFGPPDTYLQSGAGKPAGSSTPTTFDRSQIDVPRRISDAEAFTTARFVAHRLGLLIGGTAGGVVLAALRMILETEDSSPDDPTRTAVAILADGGEQYLDTIHAPGWLEQHHLTDEETWKYLSEMTCR
jgi:cystathionine beta-synthase